MLDLNVFVSALLSPRGAPAAILSAWYDGAFELVVSETLLLELGVVLDNPKLKRHIDPAEAAEFASALRAQAIVADDPPPGTYRSVDPDDDHLLALAEVEGAILVSGDAHLLDVGPGLPIETPRAFLERIQS